MAIALVASTSATGTDSSVTTGSIDTTGATLLVICIAVDGGATPTISDSKSNTWTALTASTQTVKTILYYVANPTVGTGHTFSNTGAFNFCSLFVQSFSGVTTTSPFDQQNGSTGTGSATLVVGSVTPSENNEVVVVGLGFNESGTPISINGGFTETSEQNFGSGNNYGGAMAYLIQTTAAAAAPTWTRGANVGAMASRSATFKAAASGPANLKTAQGLAKASVKTIDGLAIASVKTVNGLN